MSFRGFVATNIFEDPKTSLETLSMVVNQAVQNKDQQTLENVRTEIQQLHARSLDEEKKDDFTTISLGLLDLVLSPDFASILLPESSQQLSKRILIFDTSLMVHDKYSDYYNEIMVNDINNSIHAIHSSVEYTNSWRVEKRGGFTVGILLLSTAQAVQEVLHRQTQSFFKLRECDIRFHACCVRDEEMLLQLPEEELEPLRKEIERVIGRSTIIQQISERNYQHLQKNKQQHDPEILNHELALLSLARMFDQNVRIILSHFHRNNPLSLNEKNDVVNYFKSTKGFQFCIPLGTSGTFIVQYESTESAMSFTRSLNNSRLFLLKSSEDPNRELLFGVSFSRLLNGLKELDFDIRKDKAYEQMVLPRNASILNRGSKQRRGRSRSSHSHSSHSSHSHSSHSHSSHSSHSHSSHSHSSHSHSSHSHSSHSHSSHSSRASRASRSRNSRKRRDSSRSLDRFSEERGNENIHWVSSKTRSSHSFIF